MKLVIVILIVLAIVFAFGVFGGDSGDVELDSSSIDEWKETLRGFAGALSPAITAEELTVRPASALRAGKITVREGSSVSVSIAISDEKTRIAKLTVPNGAELKIDYRPRRGDRAMPFTDTIRGGDAPLELQALERGGFLELECLRGVGSPKECVLSMGIED